MSAIVIYLISTFYIDNTMTSTHTSPEEKKHNAAIVPSIYHSIITTISLLSFLSTIQLFISSIFYFFLQDYTSVVQLGRRVCLHDMLIVL